MADLGQEQTCLTSLSIPVCMCFDAAGRHFVGVSRRHSFERQPDARVPLKQRCVTLTDCTWLRLIVKMMIEPNSLPRV